MMKTKQQILGLLKTKKPQISLIGSETRNTLTALQLDTDSSPVDINTGGSTASHHWSTALKSTATLNAHLVLVQLNPITENHLLNRLPISHIHQHLFLLLDSHIPTHLIKPAIPESNHKTFFINSHLAIKAIHSYQDEHHPSSTAIDQLRDSGLVQLREAIHDALHNRAEHNHIRVALSLSELALAHASERLLRISEEINSADQRLYTYQLRLNKIKNIAAHHILFPYPTLSTTFTKNLPKQLGFFRLPFISHLVGLRALKTLEETSLNQMEKDLIFQAGQIKLLQERAQEVIEELIGDGILKPYRTETEMNGVLQVRRQREVVFTQARGWVGIFAERKAQLIGQGGPLHLLQTRANALVRNNLIAGFGLSVFSFSNYLSVPLSPPYDALISSHHHQPTLSIFLLVSIIYLSQASWAKSLSAFAKDLARWNLSLKHDLLVQHQKMVDELVNLSMRPTSVPPESGSEERPQGTAEDERDFIASMRGRMEARKEVTQEERAQLKAAHPVLAPLLDNHPGPLTFLQLTHLLRDLILDLKHMLDHHQASP